MVMMIVCCTGCRKSGEFDIELSFQAKRDRCAKCSHDSSHPWRFNFCILPCFIDWMKKKNVAELGFPCQDCINMETGEASGFFCGFEQNGRCKTCDGTKTVKGRLVSVDAMAAVAEQNKRVSVTTTAAFTEQNEKKSKKKT